MQSQEEARPGKQIRTDTDRPTGVVGPPLEQICPERQIPFPRHASPRSCALVCECKGREDGRRGERGRPHHRHLFLCCLCASC